MGSSILSAESYSEPDNQAVKRWDDLESDKYHTPIDEELRARLERLPLRAILAYTIAVAEWIIYRFLPLLDNPLPSEYLEATWAQVVNWRYAADWYAWAEDDEWIGPVKGTIYEAFLRTHPARH